MKELSLVLTKKIYWQIIFQHLTGKGEMCSFLFQLDPKEKSVSIPIVFGKFFIAAAIKGRGMPEIDLWEEQVLKNESILQNMFEVIKYNRHLKLVSP